MINCYAVIVFILFQIRAVGDGQQINYSPSNMKICFLCCLNLPVLIPDEGLGVGLGWGVVRDDFYFQTSLWCLKSL